MGRPAVAVIALALVGCPKEPESPKKMRDPRVFEVARACAKDKFGGKGAGGCELRLNEAEIDDAVGDAGEHVFHVTFDEERCGKPRFASGLILEIDDGGTCRKLGPTSSP